MHLAHMTFPEAIFVMVVFLAGVVCGFGLALRRHATRAHDADQRNTP
jgi:hypothetical protein